MFAYFFYLYSALMPIKLGFFFDGASRYIPLRITIFLSLLSLFLTIISNKKIISRKFFIFSSVYIIISLVFLLSWILQTSSNDLNLSKFITGFIFPYLIIFNIYIASKILTYKQLIKSIKIYVASSLFLITIDTIIRLMFPDYAFKGELNEFSAELARDSFYIYKYGSIMYLDSNYVALHLLVIFSLVLSFFENKTKNLLLILIGILIFLTFSRSAYIGVLFILFLSYFHRKKSTGQFILATIVSISFLFLVYYFSAFGLHTDDKSINSKLEILNSLENLDRYPILTIIFGIGFEVGGYLYSFREGAYSHSLFALLLGEVGILGMSLYLSVLLFLYKIQPKNPSAIIPVMIVCGISLIDPWDSIYIYSLSMMYIIHSNARLNNV